ncbi:hypothetical protein C475_03954 [Halosimplex carlsbadense 2-9-1]|uniref:Sjogrens syndrome scleroderma autoantigen 1 n=1 Tax=Halosimplex carlsbadense 2-9-1 TaxID=797114 RepID=M0D1E6_9EURY|nr:Sjogren's syndrome/scleroderma autoantigen 1 family protein [Halosimplex carlsbadense]ELZ29341.1 hypothetical protein C475_03954 [Halosimplex carlsbadense 2-9-1]
MSDFDKEAERERLREKYEQDKQKREASERMSDLLLKGATMTNAHCNDCGDPIFRYDGDEFCPTCQRVVTNDEAVEEAAEGEGQVDEPVETPEEAGEAGSAEADGTTDRPQTAENGDTPDHIEVKQPDGPAVRTGADEAGAGESAVEGASANAGSARSQHQPTQEQSSQQPTQQQSSQQPTQEQPSRQPTQQQPNQPHERPSRNPSETSAAPTASGDDFGSARASLVRTLRKHAERAENADDPRRARDHLAAAREAAEALGALSGSY